MRHKDGWRRCWSRWRHKNWICCATTCASKPRAVSSEKVNKRPDTRWIWTLFFSYFLSRSSITMQIRELSNRLDHIESGLRQDVRMILNILQNQQPPQQSQQPDSQDRNRPIAHSHEKCDKTPFHVTSYQPSESDFSFDLFGGNGKRQRNTMTQANVQRSISQPECTNASGTDKSLFK